MREAIIQRQLAAEGGAGEDGARLHSQSPLMFSASSRSVALLPSPRQVGEGGGPKIFLRPF